MEYTDCSNDFTIRQATEKDIPAIEAMYKARVVYNDAHNIHQWDLHDVTWDAFSSLYTIQDYYVGEHNGQLVGGLFIVDVDELYWKEKQQGESLYLHKLCTHPEHASKGYADKLISFFKAKGKKEGYSYVCLDVRAYKEKLRAMYERNGFVYYKSIKVHTQYETILYQYHF